MTGDIDVGDTAMLLTVTDLRCWWRNRVADFFHLVGDLLNVLNWSPISQTCHQHICCPTSLTNIHVTELTS